MLDPWVIEEIKKREREKEERERQQPTVEIEEPQRRPEDDGHPDSGHEMPADRKPGYEMPNPNEPSRTPEKKRDDEPKRGVDISRISGNDEDDKDDDGSITIDIRNLPKLPPEDLDEKPAEKPAEKKPE